jgi:hypothetical protein
MKLQMTAMKEREEKLQNKCVHFTHGLALIVITATQKIIYQDIDVIVEGMKNLVTQTWSCLILAENIVNKKDMKLVRMQDVISFAIQEVVHLVLLKFLYLVFVAKNNREFNAKILKNKNSIAKIFVVNF